jgi:hypothetical protein
MAEEQHDGGMFIGSINVDCGPITNVCRPAVLLVQLQDERQRTTAD